MVVTLPRLMANIQPITYKYNQLTAALQILAEHKFTLRTLQFSTVLHSSLPRPRDQPNLCLTGPAVQMSVVTRSGCHTVAVSVLTSPSLTASCLFPFALIRVCFQWQKSVEKWRETEADFHPFKSV